MKTRHNLWKLSMLALLTGLIAGCSHTNSIGMAFVPIPAGSFLMGANKDSDKEALDNEAPPHQVTISQPFYLGKFEVTQAQWKAVMGNNPSNYKHRDKAGNPEADDLPVEQVSWDEVQEFIRRLNEKEGTVKYRLPTEAEWEYAARAGASSRYFFGDDESQAEHYAWYRGNSNQPCERPLFLETKDNLFPCWGTRPVGQKKPNPWGLHDMPGNVWE
jgi:formylglycine-generating enzyme required for sulfatase activity